MDMEGPRPTSELLEASKSLTPQQARVLDLVMSRPGGLTALEISQELGIHVSTVREHVDALVSNGLVCSKRAPRYSGNGRPRLVYVALVPTSDAITQHFISMVRAGVELHGGRDEKREFARAWGREWARLLVDEGGLPSGDSLLGVVVQHMAELGFAPTVEAGLVELHHCPLLPADGVMPEVICQIHGGMIEELLSARGNGEIDVEIVPFAGNGTCTVRLLQQEGAGETGSASGGDEQ